MATVVPFLPSNTRKFTFPALLDSVNCTIDVTWNVAAQRFFINVYNANGDWLITTALTQTPPARQIQAVDYDPFRLVLNCQMVDPTQWPIPLSPGGLVTKPGTMIDYTLEGFSPNTYNGKFRGLHITETTFTIPMLVTPPPVNVLGFVSRYMNMISTIFTRATLIYRNGAFEIGP